MSIAQEPFERHKRLLDQKRKTVTGFMGDTHQEIIIMVLVPIKQYTSRCSALHVETRSEDLTAPLLAYMPDLTHSP